MNKRQKKKRQKEKEKIAKVMARLISKEMDEVGVFENNIFEGVNIKGVWGPHTIDSMKYKLGEKK